MAALRKDVIQRVGAAFAEYKEELETALAVAVDQVKIWQGRVTTLQNQIIAVESVSDSPIETNGTALMAPGGTGGRVNTPDGSFREIVRKAIEDHPGSLSRHIVTMTGLSVTQVGSAIQNLRRHGVIESRSFGEWHLKSESGGGVAH